GIYCIVFGLSIHVLFRHNSSAHKLYKACTIALFTLATLYTAVRTCGICRDTLLAFNAATAKDYTSFIQYAHGDDRKTAWLYVNTLILNFHCSSIADTMLIHRCYIIFNSNKLILYPLISVAFILNGCVTFIPKSNLVDTGAVIGIVVFQIILTSLTAGRIWWITSESRKLGARSTHSRFNDIMAIIIESALLYVGILFTGVILNGIVWDPDSVGIAPFD
ncbi:hypothetical protein L218DRAFT_839542, partial [Marasmius fiardii PR-910]